MVDDVVSVIEAVGVVVLVVGASLAFITSGRELLRRSGSPGTGAYDDLRRNLARVILLGLEVLILADIIKTIVVDQTPQSVAVLGIIVVARRATGFRKQQEMRGGNTHGGRLVDGRNQLVVGR